MLQEPKLLSTDFSSCSIIHRLEISLTRQTVSKVKSPAAHSEAVRLMNEYALGKIALKSELEGNTQVCNSFF